MASAFEAFEPSVVVDDFARKIESLCVWENTLIAGLSDGSLLFFNQQSNGDQESAKLHSTWQVTRVQKNFSKRSILQLQVLEQQSSLLSLSDEGVQLHTLPALQLVSQASRTARASAFSWDDSRQLLVTAIKKKVVSHQLDTSRNFIEMTEYNLPEPVHCLSWVDTNIVLGTTKSYWLIVPAASQTVEVLPGQVMTIYPAVQPQLLFAAGTTHPAVMTKLHSGEVLITKDAVSYFLGPDGKPSRKTSLTWSQPPKALMASKLYVAALLPSAVEVKSISRVGAAAEQMLRLPGMTVAAPGPAPDGCLYIASESDTGIRQLKPVPLEKQAKLLAAAGDFQGALELLTLLEDEETGAGDLKFEVTAAKRQQLEDVLRLRFGYHLFEAGEPDEALTQFSMCSDPDPLLLLQLYRSLVPDKFVPLLPKSAYGEPLPELHAAAAAAGREAGTSQDASGKAASAGSDSSSAAAAAAVSVVVPYLLSHRTRLLASLEEASNNAAATAAATAAAAETLDMDADSSSMQQQQQQQDHKGQASDLEKPSGDANSDSSSGSSSSKQRPWEELKLIATVIDTAILRAMLLQPDSGALLRLLQQVNYVDLEDGEAVLTAAGRYAELAALFQYNRRHEQGLTLLQQLSQNPEALPVPPTGAGADLKGLPGVWAAVRYLIAMQPQDLQLLVRHAGWVLAADPEAGLEAVLAQQPPVQPELIMPIMQEYAPAYTAVYLESALDLGLVSPKEVHSELLLIYLNMALEEEREGDKSSEAHARQLSLSDLLVSRPRQLLKLFPDDKTQWGAPTPRSTRDLDSEAGVTSSYTSKKDGTSSDTKAGDWGRDGAGALLSPRDTASALSDPNHPQHRSDAYQRLRELVYASEHIDPEYVLSKLGQGQLLEIRALMLERLGRHREALSVYIHDLKAMKLAEEYCDRVYEGGLAAAGAGPGVTPVDGVTGDGTSDDTLATDAAAGNAAGSTIVSGTAAVAGSTKALGAWGVPNRGLSLSSRQLTNSPVTTGKLAGAAAGPNWGKVQPGKLQQQRQQQLQQRRGRQRQQQGVRRNWAVLPFGSQPHDIYMELVDAVIQGSNRPQGGTANIAAGKGQQQQVVDQEAWRELGQLLSRKTDRINHLQVLNVLPQQLPLADLASLLSSMLLYNTEQTRNLSVILALRKAENLMAREDLVKVKQRVVTLTFDRACCMCHKRMGGAVSVAYPNGALAHYLCYRRSTGQQQQGQPLWDNWSGGSSSSGAAAVSGTAGWSNGVQQQQQYEPAAAGQEQQQQQGGGGGWGGLLAAAAH